MTSTVVLDAYASSYRTDKRFLCESRHSRELMLKRMRSVLTEKTS